MDCGKGVKYKTEAPEDSRVAMAEKAWLCFLTAGGRLPRRGQIDGGLR